MYPKLSAGTAGLQQDSVVLIDQLLSADDRRVISYLGSLSEEEHYPILCPILERLNTLLNLS
jgi:mRNA-degrading endonuclease toxin of MazEF toxin-antitoxin module